MCGHIEKPGRPMDRPTHPLTTGGVMKNNKTGQILIEFLFLICLVFGFLTCILLLQETAEKEIQSNRLKGKSTQKLWKR